MKANVNELLLGAVPDPNDQQVYRIRDDQKIRPSIYPETQKLHFHPMLEIPLVAAIYIISDSEASFIVKTNTEPTSSPSFIVLSSTASSSSISNKPLLESSCGI